MSTSVSTPVSMTISSVLGNGQRLDGGAMFGNAPRALWQRLYPPDEEHRITLACRALLVEVGERKVLLETGIGVFFRKELRTRFGVFEEEHVLLSSLAKLGLTDSDITDVVLSHLHFDHAGGLLSPYKEGEPLRLLFPRARFFVGEKAMARAQHPHQRDRASFIPELPSLLAESGRLHLIAGERSELLPWFRFHRSDGHTPGLLLTEVEGTQGSVVFLSDLCPGRAWVHLPMTMGYDRYPEHLIEEKERLFGDLLSRGAKVFFTHDAEVALCSLTRDANGRFGTADTQAEVVRQAI